MVDVHENAVGPQPKEIRIIGFKINPLQKHELLEFISWHIINKRRAIVAHLNLHGLAMMYESAAMTRLMKKAETIVAVDGMSILMLSRLLGYKLRAKHRVTSLDYIDDLCKTAAKLGWNIYYVGAKKEVLDQGVAYFKKKYPSLNICGHHGYFLSGAGASDGVERALLSEIASRKIDLLIVGMGMPRQEEWIDSILDLIEVPVILTIGAMLEYFTGSLKLPPRWLGPLGLEWLFRLVTSPRRLAFRYLIEPFVLLKKLVMGRPV